MAEETRTTSTVRQAPYLEDFQKKILEASFARGETPVSIPDIQVAGLDPLTQQASTIGQGIGQFMPYLTTGAETIGTGLSTLQAQAAGAPEMFAQAQQQALGTTGAYDPTSAAAFMDPYQQAVTTDALAEMRRQADIQSNQLAAQAVGAGAFGGSREGIAQAELGVIWPTFKAVAFLKTQAATLTKRKTRHRQPLKTSSVVSRAWRSFLAVLEALHLRRLFD